MKTAFSPAGDPCRQKVLRAFGPYLILRQSVMGFFRDGVFRDFLGLLGCVVLHFGYVIPAPGKILA